MDRITRPLEGPAVAQSHVSLVSMCLCSHYCSHAGLCDALVILEGLVVVELPLVPLVVLLPLQHRQQALKRAV